MLALRQNRERTMEKEEFLLASIPANLRNTHENNARVGHIYRWLYIVWVVMSSPKITIKHMTIPLYRWCGVDKFSLLHVHCLRWYREWVIVSSYYEFSINLLMRDVFTSIKEFNACVRIAAKTSAYIFFHLMLVMNTSGFLLLSLGNHLWPLFTIIYICMMLTVLQRARLWPEFAMSREPYMYVCIYISMYV